MCKDGYTYVTVSRKKKEKSNINLFKNTQSTE